MKIIVAIVLFVSLAGSLEARKKDHWKEKKMKYEMALQVSEDKGHKTLRLEDHNSRMKSHKMKHYFGKKKSKNAWKKARKAKKTHKVMEWMSIRSDFECGLKCKKGEVCILSPIMVKPICMHKKDLKKSMKVLHKFHKKDIKAWIKQKKHNHKMRRMDKEEKYGKINKHDEEAMKMKEKEKHARKDHFHKKDKKDHHKEKHNKPQPKYTAPVCGQKEFEQMKNRMMAWFHLLHGRDHKARKAHGGSLGKFYKHVSVKKELRELDGIKCQCMRSATWEFHQLDTDVDGHVTEKELIPMEQNSLEPCLRPFLQSCDLDGDKRISSNEWCCCFNHMLPPCYEKMKEIKKSGKPVTYLPRCDKEGYFMLEQCKGEDDGNQKCWCVDQNGNEYQDTAKEGRAHCHKIEKFAYSKKMVPLV